MMLLGLAAEAEAQRPFSTLDPFYQDESARRGFFDGFAVQADLAYRGSEPSVGSGAAIRPLALGLRVDYALARQMDVSAVFDVSNGFDAASSGTPVRLSWIVAKPYWRYGQTDYAIRLAVDPSGDGGLGFRQTDVAYLSTSDLSPTLSTDFAIGLRRTRAGFERLEIPSELPTARPALQAALPEIVRSRATGVEGHFMWGYRYFLHPGGSHVFTTVSAEAMAYTLVTASRVSDGETAGRVMNASTVDEGRLRGGTGRLHVGAEYARPSFILAPYVSLPLFRVVEFEGESRTWGPTINHARLGLRFTVR
jgi:hypothetical protein